MIMEIKVLKVIKSRIFIECTSQPGSFTVSELPLMPQGLSHIQLVSIVKK